MTHAVDNELVRLGELTDRRIRDAIAQHVSPRAERPFVVASRSDSTLRGHFPAEPLALQRGLSGPLLSILPVQSALTQINLAPTKDSYSAVLP